MDQIRILEDVFDLNTKRSDSVCTATDRIFCAASQFSELFMTTRSSDHLEVVYEGNPIEIGLPVGGKQYFRAILARSGVICACAERKKSFVGKARAYLSRHSIINDYYGVEQNDKIEYIEAYCNNKEGISMYRYDVNLRIKNCKKEVLMNVIMNNTSGVYSLSFHRLSNLR